MSKRRTRFAPQPFRDVPIIGTVGRDGVVTLFETPQAKRLAGPKAWPTPAND